MKAEVLSIKTLKITKKPSKILTKQQKYNQHMLKLTFYEEYLKFNQENLANLNINKQFKIFFMQNNQDQKIQEFIKVQVKLID